MAARPYRVGDLVCGVPQSLDYWWPAQVADISHAPEKLRKGLAENLKKKHPAVILRYFGSPTFEYAVCEDVRVELLASEEELDAFLFTPATGKNRKHSLEAIKEMRHLLRLRATDGQHARGPAEADLVDLRDPSTWPDDLRGRALLPCVRAPTADECRRTPAHNALRALRVASLGGQAPVTETVWEKLLWSRQRHAGYQIRQGPPAKRATSAPFAGWRAPANQESAATDRGRHDAAEGQLPGPERRQQQQPPSAEDDAEDDAEDNAILVRKPASAAGQNAEVRKAHQPAKVARSENEKDDDHLGEDEDEDEGELEEEESGGELSPPPDASQGGPDRPAGSKRYPAAMKGRKSATIAKCGWVGEGPTAAGKPSGMAGVSALGLAGPSGPAESVLTRLKDPGTAAGPSVDAASPSVAPPGVLSKADALRRPTQVPAAVAAVGSGDASLARTAASDGYEVAAGPDSTVAANDRGVTQVATSGKARPGSAPLLQPPGGQGTSAGESPLRQQQRLTPGRSLRGVPLGAAGGSSPRASEAADRAVAAALPAAASGATADSTTTEGLRPRVALAVPGISSAGVAEADDGDSDKVSHRAAKPRGESPGGDTPAVPEGGVGAQEGAVGAVAAVELAAVSRAPKADKIAEAKAGKSAAAPCNDKAAAAAASGAVQTAGGAAGASSSELSWQAISRLPPRVAGLSELQLATVSAAEGRAVQLVRQLARDPVPAALQPKATRKDLRGRALILLAREVCFSNSSLAEHGVVGRLCTSLCKKLAQRTGEAATATDAHVQDSVEPELERQAQPMQQPEQPQRKRLKREQEQRERAQQKRAKVAEDDDRPQKIAGPRSRDEAGNKVVARADSTSTGSARTDSAAARPAGLPAKEDAKAAGAQSGDRITAAALLASAPAAGTGAVGASRPSSSGSAQSKLAVPNAAGRPAAAAPKAKAIDEEFDIAAMDLPLQRIVDVSARRPVSGGGAGPSAPPGRTTAHGASAPHRRPATAGTGGPGTSVGGLQLSSLVDLKLKPTGATGAAAGGAPSARLAAGSRAAVRPAGADQGPSGTSRPVTTVQPRQQPPQQQPQQQAQSQQQPQQPRATLAAAAPGMARGGLGSSDNDDDAGGSGACRLLIWFERGTMMPDKATWDQLLGACCTDPNRRPELKLDETIGQQFASLIFPHERGAQQLEARLRSHGCDLLKVRSMEGVKMELTRPEAPAKCPWPQKPEAQSAQFPLPPMARPGSRTAGAAVPVAARLPAALEGRGSRQGGPGAVPSVKLAPRPAVPTAPQRATGSRQQTVPAAPHASAAPAPAPIAAWVTQRGRHRESPQPFGFEVTNSVAAAAPAMASTYTPWWEESGGDDQPAPWLVGGLYSPTRGEEEEEEEEDEQRQPTRAEQPPPHQQQQQQQEDTDEELQQCGEPQQDSGHADRLLSKQQAQPLSGALQPGTGADSDHLAATAGEPCFKAGRSALLPPHLLPKQRSLDPTVVAAPLQSSSAKLQAAVPDDPRVSGDPGRTYDRGSRAAALPDAQGSDSVLRAETGHRASKHHRIGHGEARHREMDRPEDRQRDGERRAHDRARNQDEGRQSRRGRSGRRSRSRSRSRSADRERESWRRSREAHDRSTSTLEADGRPRSDRGVSRGSRGTGEVSRALQDLSGSRGGSRSQSRSRSQSPLGQNSNGRDRNEQADVPCSGTADAKALAPPPPLSLPRPPPLPLPPHLSPPHLVRHPPPRNPVNREGYCERERESEQERDVGGDPTRSTDRGKSREVSEGRRADARGLATVDGLQGGISDRRPEASAAETRLLPRRRPRSRSPSRSRSQSRSASPRRSPPPKRRAPPGPPHSGMGSPSPSSGPAQGTRESAATSGVPPDEGSAPPVTGEQASVSSGQGDSAGAAAGPASSHRTTQSATSSALQSGRAGSAEPAAQMLQMYSGSGGLQFVHPNGQTYMLLQMPMRVLQQGGLPAQMMMTAAGVPVVSSMTGEPITGGAVPVMFTMASVEPPLASSTEVAGAGEGGALPEGAGDGTGAAGAAAAGEGTSAAMRPGYFYFTAVPTAVTAATTVMAATSAASEGGVEAWGAEAAAHGGWLKVVGVGNDVAVQAALVPGSTIRDVGATGAVQQQGEQGHEQQQQQDEQHQFSTEDAGVGYGGDSSHPTAPHLVGGADPSLSSLHEVVGRLAPDHMQLLLQHLAGVKELDAQLGDDL